MPSRNNNHDEQSTINFVSARYIGDDDDTMTAPDNNHGVVVKAEPALLGERVPSIQVSASNVVSAPPAAVATATPVQDMTTHRPTSQRVLAVAPLSPDNRHLPVARATPILRRHPSRRTHRSRHYNNDNDGGARVKRVLHPRARRFKRRRQRAQVAALVLGGAAGGVLLGPLGGVILGFAAHGISKQVGRARQAQLERRIAQQEQEEAQTRVTEATA